MLPQSKWTQSHYNLGQVIDWFWTNGNITKYTTNSTFRMYKWTHNFMQRGIFADNVSNMIMARQTLSKGMCPPCFVRHHYSWARLTKAINHFDINNRKDDPRSQERSSISIYSSKNPDNTMTLSRITLEESLEEEEKEG